MAPGCQQRALCSLQGSALRCSRGRRFSTTRTWRCWRLEIRHIAAIPGAAVAAASAAALEQSSKAPSSTSSRRASPCCGPRPPHQRRLTAVREAGIQSSAFLSGSQVLQKGSVIDFDLSCFAVIAAIFAASETLVLPTMGTASPRAPWRRCVDTAQLGRRRLRVVKFRAWSRWGSARNTSDHAHCSRHV